MDEMVNSQKAENQEEKVHEGEQRTGYSRRKFLQTVGAATLGVIAAKVVVPDFITKAVASELEDLARAKAATAISPHYQRFVAELGQQGFLFDLDNGIIEYGPYNGMALVVPSVGPTRQVGAFLSVTLDLAQAPHNEVRIYVLHASIDRCVYGGDIEIRLITEFLQYGDFSNPPIPGVRRFEQLITATPGAPISAPALPPHNSIGPVEYIAVPENGVCEDDRYEDCDPSDPNEWYFDRCLENMWCGCRFGYPPDPRYYAVRACKRRREYRNCRQCHERPNCQTSCGAYYSYSRTVSVPCSEIHFSCEDP